MYLKLPIILFIVFVFSLLVSSFTKKHNLAAANAKDSHIDTTISYLAMYGAYIFKRENCTSCHVLNQSRETEIVSLDGLGGKYPDSWHYHHLMNPQSMVATSTMPSYEYLEGRMVEKDSVLNNIPNASEEIWNQIRNEGKKMKADLTADHISLNAQSEIIALLAYLNSIPETDELKSILKIENDRIAIENRIKDSMWQNAESLILTIASDKNNIKAGASLFSHNCTPCHGLQGDGIIGPNLTDNKWLHGGSALEIAETLKNGVQEKGMPSWKYEFTPTEVGQLVAYIKSLQNPTPENTKKKQGKKA